MAVDNDIARYWVRLLISAVAEKYAFDRLGSPWEKREHVKAADPVTLTLLDDVSMSILLRAEILTANGHDVPLIREGGLVSDAIKKLEARTGLKLRPLLK